MRGPQLIRVEGVWHYRFQVDGRRVKRTTRERNRPRALAIAQEAYRAAVARSRGEEPEPILRDLVTQWVVAHERTRTVGHVENMARFGRLHLGELANLRLSKVTTEAVEAQRSSLLRTHAPATVNIWLDRLRTVFHWAIRRRMIRSIPFEVSKARVKAKPKLILPKAKTGAWLEAAERFTRREPAVFLLVLLLLGLGLRISEAQGARWEWLDFERARYTPGLTKGGEAWARPVPEWLLERLRPISRPEGPMFRLRSGGAIHRGRVVRLVSRCCAEVGTPRLTPHRLRGTYATWLADLGVPIQGIKTVLGHKDIKTTIGYLEHDLVAVENAQRMIAQDLLGYGPKTAHAPKDHREATA